MLAKVLLRVPRARNQSHGIVPHKLIEYLMSDGQEAVKSEFIERAGDVLVMVAFDAETENSPEVQRNGWQAILNNFSRYVEAKD